MAVPALAVPAPHHLVKVVRRTQGRAETPEEAPVAAAPMAPAQAAPAPIAFGPNSICGQFIGDRLQTQGTAIWGVMGVPPGCPVDSPTTTGHALALAAAARDLSRGSILEFSFGRVFLAAFALAHHAELQNWLGAHTAVDGLYLFHVASSKTWNKKGQGGNPLRVLVSGLPTRIATYPARSIPKREAAERVVIAHSQSHSFNLKTVILEETQAPERPDPQSKRRKVSAKDEEILEALEHMDMAAATFEEAIMPAKRHVKMHQAAAYFEKADKYMRAWAEKWREERPGAAAFELPPREIHLTVWHRRLLWNCRAAPKKRRLFWITGPPLCGKGSLVEFLTDIDLQASVIPFQSEEWVLRKGLDITSLMGSSWEKTAAQYDKHGCPGFLILDLPKDFEMNARMRQWIEKLTDVGQRLVSGRYEGANPQLKSHVVVFGNGPPNSGLDNREVWWLDITGPGDDPQWQFPFKNPTDQDDAARAAAVSARAPLQEDVAALAAAAAPAAGPAGPVPAPVWTCVLM